MTGRYPMMAGFMVIAPVLMFGAAPVAAAREVTVMIDAKAGPWEPAANKKMPFGRDGGPPVVVKVPDLPGAKVSIYAEGTTVSAGHGAVGANGVDGKAVDDRKGPGRKVYPSLYAPKILYPANLHALIAVFVDAQGVVLGRPFVVGDGVRVGIPEGADAVSLGFNDVDFAKNSGTLKVTVDVPDE